MSSENTIFLSSNDCISLSVNSNPNNVETSLVLNSTFFSFLSILLNMLYLNTNL